MPSNTLALSLFAVVALASAAKGQSASFSWRADTAITATAGTVTNSLPIGTDLAIGNTVSASASGYIIFSGSWSTSAGTAFSSTASGNTQTFVTAQNASKAGVSNSPTASSSGFSMLSLTSAQKVWARLSVSSFGAGGFPLPMASVDVGNDGAIEWAGAFGNWETVVAVEGTVNIRIGASIFGQFNGGRSLQVRLDYFSAQVGVGSALTPGVPGIAPSGGAAAVGNAGFGLAGTGFLPNGLAVMLVKVGPVLGVPGFGIPGAQPGCLIFAGLPQDLVGVAVVADGGGVASFPLPLPAGPALVGLPLGAQWLGIDPALPFPLPFGSSAALSISITN